MDYSDWLTKGRLEVEMIAWKQARFHDAYAYDITQVVKEAELKKPSILEFGCGPSLIPAELDFKFKYKGVDKFPLCIVKAKLLNPDLDYEEIDIRDFYTEKKFDIACAFAFLKHFTLEELPVIFSKLFKSGDICIFSIPIGDANVDDLSNGFPHTFVTRKFIEKLAKSYGHEIISISESIGPVELVYVTQKIEVKTSEEEEWAKKKTKKKAKK